MCTKFIMIQGLIISVDLIKSIRCNGQNLLVETVDQSFFVSYLSEFEALEELYRFYEILSN